ncbi:sensor domain-containing diguanylate cyclase [Pseudomonas jinjuensis]|uniref:PAS domain S-box-containing protein/diguanylate cyclase (GGDEF) domain-containing protein n=1 Tax=Pseudomonas jinjuensis TaxID=198616 RepID=A0A1G9Z1A0_9PSED|nr:diguanylate cyclase [Pseudomonas jinjuensis]SDN14977.1 PAS domain S-box-containing protein/diguanylate cyclase (GGDEF) domain-containing protein [Pseudomonas jinjuensis]
MSLRKRLFCLAAPLIFMTLLLAYVLAQTELLTRFDAYEQEQLEGEANSLALQLDSFISRSLDVLRVSAWSDPLYDSIRIGHGNEVTHPNLDIDSVRNQDFNFLLFFDNQGKILGEQWIMPDRLELRRGATQPTRDELRGSVLSHAEDLGLLQPHASPRHSTAQMLLIKGVPTVLVSSPISNSAGTATPAGNAIAGRFLGLHRQALLKRFIGGDLRFLPPGGEELNWSLIPGHMYLRNTNFHVAPRQLDEHQQQEIDLRMLNSQGEPEMRLRIIQPRYFYVKGKEAIGFFLMLTTLTGVVALALGYLGLEFWVLRRVQKLNREIASIGPDSPLPHLSGDGDDEIGQLTGELNGMLERLARSEDRGQAVLDSISDGYLEIDMFDRISKANRALYGMLGYTPNRLIGHPFSALFEPQEGHPEPMRLRQILLERHQLSFRTPLKCHNGNLRWFEASFSVILGKGGKGVAGFRGILRDISEQMAYQSQLLDMAYRDALTGLGNRKAFQEQLEAHLNRPAEESEVTALLFIDLDHFKDVNDRHGHDVGDQLLITVASRLRGSLRQPDLSFRLGGDEFTVLLHSSDQHQAMALGERLLKALGEPYALGDLLIDVISPSIGIALYPLHANTADTLLKAADSAMYRAKRRRNCCCLYDAEVDAAADKAAAEPAATS